MQKKRNFSRKIGIHFKFLLTATLLVIGNFDVFAQTISGQSEPNASVLLKKYIELKDQLAQNQYRRPLFIESFETATTVTSTAYAVLDAPFSTVSDAFNQPSQWCEVLILHINTKYCRANTNSTPNTLAVNVGKKTPQLLSEAFPLEFSFRKTAATVDFLAVQLHAEKGPLSTSDYQMELLVAPLPEGKTFMKLRYSYGFGLPGRLAMQAYLSTIGRGKFGFTKVMRDTEVAYVEGMRGTVERNTMRYFLAIEAYLASLKRSSTQQFDTRLHYWFNATEQYSQQLHEVDLPDYLAMKRDEYRRQQTPPLITQ